MTSWRSAPALAAISHDTIRVKGNSWSKSTLFAHTNFSDIIIPAEVLGWSEDLMAAELFK